MDHRLFLLLFNFCGLPGCQFPNYEVFGADQLLMKVCMFVSADGVHVARRMALRDWGGGRRKLGW